MAARRPALPETIKVLGRSCKVKFVPQEEQPECAGQWLSPSLTLQITTEQSPFDETDTVLHELFHAILHCQGRPYGGKTEETYVHGLASGLLTVLRDNPKFASWLCKPPPDPK
jgi:hypothetical protein